jgi:pyruvate-ferredoxin/flavodoxin oxidoreductase
MSTAQARLAVESRAYPLFRYDPDAGLTPEECFDLDGNPAPDRDWPTYTLKYTESGREKQMELPMTFADFAVSEARFRKHFRAAPPDTWNESMLPLADFLDLESDEREGRFPYLWSVNRESELSRLLVDGTMVESCEDRRDFWTMLRALAGVGKQEDSPEDVEARVRQDVADRIAAALLQLADAPGGTAVQLTSAALPGVAAESAETAGKAGPAASDAMAPWIDTEECTSCDECTGLNPEIFVYDERGKAIIKNPAGGPYKDLVKAAERCTARVIHPGMPRDRRAKDIEKWIARGSKFN